MEGAIGSSAERTNAQSNLDKWKKEKKKMLFNKHKITHLGSNSRLH